MPNTVISIRSSGQTGNIPSLGVVANGELSLNYADGILYYKTASNTLGQIKTTQVSGLDTEIQFNDVGSFGSHSGLTYNKTSSLLTVSGNIVSGNLSTTGSISSSAFFDDGLNVTGHAQAAFDTANTATTNAQAAFNKANSSAQQAFVTITANGTNVIADANNDTLTLTAATSNGIAIVANASSDTIDFGLRSSGVTAGTYGNNSTAVTITIDQFGRITSVSQTAITVSAVESDPFALTYAIALG